MASLKDTAVDELIELSRLLGEFGQIKRATLLPNGDPESDSHHSFSLALIAYELACQYAPELDTHKILLYALVHDLTEIITGDVDTLNSSPEELERKAQADALALAQAEAKLTAAPHLVQALREYEHKANDEALFVYWVDKVCVIPTHFYDGGANLRKRGIRNRQDIQAWYDKTLAKLQKQPQTPHESVVDMFARAYQKMHDEVVSA